MIWMQRKENDARFQDVMRTSDLPDGHVKPKHFNKFGGREGNRLQLVFHQVARYKSSDLVFEKVSVFPES
jgi:hypothetical protein